MTRLVGVVLTLNESEHITDCISSLKWVDEVVVFDSYSTDDTIGLALAAGATILQHQFENYGAQRNAALSMIDAEWVLFVDADERVTPELAEETRSKLDQSERGWWVPRHNYIFGKLTKGAGWYPDHQLRLLHRDSAHYDSTRPVHEEVILEGKSGYLQHPLIHYNYRDVSQFHEKQKKYARFEAGIRREAGLSAKVWTYFTAPMRQFWWRFVTLRGHQDGLHGLRLSLLMAYYEHMTWRYVGQT